MSGTSLSPFDAQDVTLTIRKLTAAKALPRLAFRNQVVISFRQVLE